MLNARAAGSPLTGLGAESRSSSDSGFDQDGLGVLDSRARIVAGEVSGQRGTAHAVVRHCSRTTLRTLLVGARDRHWSP
eukprot:4115364-Prymnesium_polylepis.1